MRPLSELSGPWIGFWIQQPIRGQMRLVLYFEAGRISGGGNDRDGAFSLQGSFDEQTGAVAIDKFYSGLLVKYRGHWDGTLICGDSEIIGFLFSDRGQFEIWPEGEDEAVQFFTQEIESVVPSN